MDMGTGGTRLRIGTCGWQYRSWQGVLYPTELPTRRWLEHYATVFDAVECDAAFYRLPERTTFEKWAAMVPDGFAMAVKASRFLTHVKRLSEPADPVRRMLDAAAGLGNRLGPFLLQLPPTMTTDIDRLIRCLRCFPPTVRVAIEPRHSSWWTADVRDALSEAHASLVWSDRSGVAQSPLWRTADFGYLRLHEGRPTFPPRYSLRVLRSWLRRITATWPDGEVFVFFNNDAGAAAVRDAQAFARLAAAEAASPPP
jgi:uncharacterized protein YecE (DUF72 family)